MVELLITIVAIALVDSLNPQATAVQVYLLGTQAPIRRAIAFIVGDFLASWTAGLIIALSMMQVISKASTPLIDLLYVLQLLLSFALIAIGCDIIPFPHVSISKLPRLLKPVHTFWLGWAVVCVEVPTALPYYIAIGRMIQTNVSLPQLALFLAFYNAIFVLPLIGLLGIYIRWQDQAIKILAKIQKIIAQVFPQMFRALLIILGILLFLDCIVKAFNPPID